MDVDDDSSSSDGESYVDGDSTAHDQLFRRKVQVVAKNVVLTEQEIRRRLRREAAATAEVLSVPDWALALLGHYRWNPLRLHEDWFSERQGRIRDAVGLGGDKPAAEMASAGCAHRYCHACWRGYVAAAVDDDDGGRRCLALRCPDASCSRAVLRGMVERFFPAGDGRDAYYIDDGPGGAADQADLACRCGHGFCWRCGGAPHRPASCAAAAAWAREGDAASADWVTLHTKPCPRCRRPAERVGGGCRIVTCAAPCFAMFCWRCLGRDAGVNWSAHDFCVEDVDDEKDTEEERRRARRELDAFLHYQDLWMANLRAQRDAEREASRLLRNDEKLLPPRARGVAEKERVDLVAEAWAQHGETDAVLERLQQAAQETAAEDLEDKFVIAADRGKLAQLIAVARRCVDNFAKAVQEEGEGVVTDDPPGITTIDKGVLSLQL
ncbi:hypothetical protein EJB05_48859, partial [Eragrostis curvula]